jgi:hypothetical protein
VADNQITNLEVAIPFQREVTGRIVLEDFPELVEIADLRGRQDHLSSSIEVAATLARTVSHSVAALRHASRVAVWMPLRVAVR